MSHRAHAHAQRVLHQVTQLYENKQWETLLALEASATTAASQLTIANPTPASLIYAVLGMAHATVGKATVDHQHRARAVQQFETALHVHDACLDAQVKILVCSELAECYFALQQYEKSLQMTVRCRALLASMPAFADKARLDASLCLGIGQCSLQLGDYEAARKHLESLLPLCAEPTQNRPRLRQRLLIYRELAACSKAQFEYNDALTWYFAELTVAKILIEEPAKQNRAMFNIGVVLWAQTRCDLPIAGFIFQRQMKRARQWFLDALGPSGVGSRGLDTTDEHTVLKQSILLHLAFVSFDLDDVHQALLYLHRFLQSLVDTARIICGGCARGRGPDHPSPQPGGAALGGQPPMLRCGGCKVARFCNAEHQAMASQQHGNMQKEVWHKDVCALLRQWRLAGKGVVTIQSCTKDQLKFLESDVWFRRQARTIPSRPSRER